MREVLTESTLFNTIAMARSETTLLLFVVEGDDDAFLLRNHLSANVQMICAIGGKSALLAAAQRAAEARLPEVLFLVDSDYDRFVSRDNYPANVMATKYHDIFMELIVGVPEVVAQLVDAFCRSKGRAIGSEEGVDAKAALERATEIASTVGHLRIANERNKLELKLRNFPLGEVTLENELQPQISELAVARSRCELTSADLVSLIADEERAIASCIELVSDHDFFRALGLVLKKAHGVAVSADDLLKGFLAGVRCDILERVAEREPQAAIGLLSAQGVLACPCAA